MRLAILDNDEKIIAEYGHEQVKELLIKYYDVHKDIGKSFDLLSEDLLQRARHI